MPQNRHTLRPTIILDETCVANIKSQGMRLLLYCGSLNQMSSSTPVDVAFPSQIEVKINNDTQQHNYKGLKNKPGTTKPVDITDLIRVQKNYTNQLSITYALTPNKYGMVVHLARVISADTLTERVRNGSVIPKNRVLEDMRRANDDADITATSVKTSLKDPVSTLRISLPVRSSACAHNQCFDAGMFLQMMAQAPTWSCPICNKYISFESLCVDKYFQDILDRTSRSIDKVDIEPNGEWTVIKEEEETMPNGLSRKPRATYDNEDDDEVIEVMDGPGRASSSARLSMPLINPVKGFPLNTPPLSSREASVAQSSASHPTQRNKRPAEVVIDLTGDDSDDDQPPRPAKRQTTRNSTSRLPAQPATPIENPPANRLQYEGDSHSRPLSSLTNTTHVASGSHDRDSPFLNSNAFHGPHSPIQQMNGNNREQGAFGMNRSFQSPQSGRPPSQYSPHQSFNGSVSLRPASTDPVPGQGGFSRPGPAPSNLDSSFGHANTTRFGLPPPPPPPPAQPPSSSQSDQTFRLAPFHGAWRNDFGSNSSSPG
nr:e3 sumo-protein ligase pli1 [Quercus suber]